MKNESAFIIHAVHSHLQVAKKDLVYGSDTDVDQLMSNLQNKEIFNTILDHIRDYHKLYIPQSFLIIACKMLLDTEKTQWYDSYR
jgi:hypothetical protein